MSVNTNVNPPMIDNRNAWRWGFTPQAELWNGRLAMIGFLGAALIKLFFFRLEFMNSYKGKFTPENLVFNANLQEFTHQISNICGLSTQGIISQEEAYTLIQILFEALKRSKHQLRIDENP